MQEPSQTVRPIDPDVVRIEPSGPPRGEVRIQGAKNSALPLIAAALLVEEGTTSIHQVPDVTDVKILLDIIKGLGARVEADWRRQTVTIDATRLDSDTPDPLLVGRLRGSLMLMAPILVRLGSIRMTRPGGCSIGLRKYHLHLAGLRSMGVEIREAGTGIEAVCPRVLGSRIVLESPTHTGTQQLILAAVRARGTTIISKASREPEVEQLCRSLTAMGARISGIASTRLVIHGVGGLRGTDVTCLPSRLETSFFAMAGCLPGGHLTIVGAAREAQPVLDKLARMGAWLHNRAPGVLEVIAPRALRGCAAVTRPYPGFPTDAQPHLMALTCFAEGRTSIRETLYENRFQHVTELLRMGADIRLSGDQAVISGPCRLVGAEVVATDLQAGAALILAALGAEGASQIHGYHHVLRGYPQLVPRLEAIGNAARLVA